jgi:hypothetical protein
MGRSAAHRAKRNVLNKEALAYIQLRPRVFLSATIVLPRSRDCVFIFNFKAHTILRSSYKYYTFINAIQLRSYAYAALLSTAFQQYPS